MVQRVARNKIRGSVSDVTIEMEAEPRESDLHDKIADECRRRGWICFHGSTAHRTRRTIGEPDCIILADGGRVFLCELKSRTGKLRPEQAAMKAWAEKLQHTVHVIRSMSEFLALAR